MKHLIGFVVLASAACGGEGAMGIAGRAPSTATGAVHSVCPNGDTTFGVDVSEWQGGIDWNAVHANGVQFAFIRAADGLYSDQTYDSNWPNARAAGVLRGTYQFFRSNIDPIQQADLLLSRMGPLQPGDLPPVADVETTDGVDAGTRAARLHAWLDHIQQATGRTPIIYVGGYFWDDNVGQDFSAYPLWHAGYTGGSCPSTVSNSWPSWTIWQYTDAANVGGISGGVDGDTFNGSLSDLLGFAQANSPPRGYLDVASCDGIGGWAQDPDAPDQAINVDLYIGGPAGSGAPGFRTLANAHRDDLCSAIGSCDHGFGLAVPFAFRDGNAHSVFAYGIDTAGGNNPELNNSEQSFTCGPPDLPLDAKSGVLRHVDSPDVMSAWQFSFNDVAIYGDDVVAAFAQVADWSSSAPQLVQASGQPEVYLVDGDTLRHVISPDSAAAWHFDLGAVQQIDPSALGTIGPDLPAAPFLLRGSGPAVFVLDVAPAPPASTGEGEGASSGEGEGASSGGEGEGASSGEGDGASGGDGGEGEGSSSGAHGTLHAGPAAHGGCASTPPSSTATLALTLALVALSRAQRRRKPR